MWRPLPPMKKSKSSPPMTVLHRKKTSVSGAELTVEQDAAGLRSLFLDGVVQSECYVQKAKKGGGSGDGEISLSQPLELVQLMSLLSASWINAGGAVDVEAPKLLLIGVGGGSIPIVLNKVSDRLRQHLVELEPEVLQAAVDFFGLELSERCTGVAGDSAKVLSAHADLCRAQPAEAYDILLLDAFTAADGLAKSTQEEQTLSNATACVSSRGMLVVNLHTGDPADDPDYPVCRRVLRALCARFDCVYAISCATTLNLLAVCHHGEMVDADAWEGRFKELMRTVPAMKTACENLNLDITMARFDFVGGKDSPMEYDEYGL